MGNQSVPVEKDGHVALDLIDKDKEDGTIRTVDGASIAAAESEEDQPYEPLPGVMPYDDRRLVTIRAILTGGVLGSLIACSNLYLGLKSGFGADATLFSAIFGYGICKMLEKSKGLGFAVPLRRMFILRLARQLSLYFPLGTASAITIRALHSASDGVSGAREKLKTISYSFLASLAWSVASSYAPGILYSWNPFWWIYAWGGHSIIGAVNWGWLSWQWSPSLIGVGMLIDLNASLSYLLGTVLAWGIIGPILVARGEATGIPYDPTNLDLITYNAFVPDQLKTAPSPRYWILWPAVFMMLAASIATIALETRNFAKLASYGFQQMNDTIAKLTGKRLVNTNAPNPIPGAPVLGDFEILDPVPKEHQVRWWEWSSVTVAAFVFAMVVLKYTYGVPPVLVLLNVFLGFLWAFVVIQVFGASGTNPTGSVAKGSQFITGAVSRDSVQKIGFEHAARSNLVGSVLSASAANQAGELCQDFRTGFLLGTPARAQWHAQMLGTLFAVFLSPALFMLFSKAFPCIIDASATTCQFALPSVTAWRVVTQAILAPEFPIAQSSWIFSVVFSVAGMALVVLKRYFMQTPKLKRWEAFVPNMSLVGLAMTIPGSAMTTTVAIGSVLSWVWQKCWPKSYARFGYAVASGGIAGEGIGILLFYITLRSPANNMAFTPVFTTGAPTPLPQFSQAVVYNGLVYCSGNIGIKPGATIELVEGTAKDRARQALSNIQAVLKASGSSLDNILKMNIYLTNMDNFGIVNEAYDEFFQRDIKPARTCVAVHQLPFGTDVEIECTAHLDATKA
ncbi:unnamed protein product [Clonostachys solani]|uniref:Uncharacterized protein n=1 Tax=Clonostachys solani TaxID=160281 RepID=A0A9P0EP36_9HYPO|nr:unnamed protein product [Clonostachys solani]